jgi:hypothetical protein
MTDRELLALCTMLYAHERQERAPAVRLEDRSHDGRGLFSLQEGYRLHCLNSLIDPAPYHREFDC